MTSGTPDKPTRMIIRYLTLLVQKMGAGTIGITETYNFFAEKEERGGDFFTQKAQRRREKRFFDMTGALRPQKY